MVMFSIVEVLGAVAPRGEAPPRGGLYLIQGAGVIVVSLALSEESWASFL